METAQLPEPEQEKVPEPVMWLDVVAAPLALVGAWFALRGRTHFDVAVGVLIILVAYSGLLHLRLPFKGLTRGAMFMWSMLLMGLYFLEVAATIRAIGVLVA